MSIVTFFVKRSYASLGAGNFAIASSCVQELAEAECLIVYTNTGLGNTFALKNITITPLDENSVTLSFDPLTDVHALPASILPKERLKESVERTVMSEDDMREVPRFCVANDASGNNPNLLALDLNCRQRFVQYHGGLCTLTDLVLALYETGVHISDIHQGVKQKSNVTAVLAQYPRTVFELNKDNGVVNDQLPMLARMTVLM
ncbi:hypothetical protein MPK66_gp255 [Erwinia phage pEa_SNUABM_2]|uniref:Uncharacterized protein n=1 Tax=Erwinia phage pEa_SNUABM_2 TaxID=2869547 RepID=A0AAE8C1P0_9CAUD|nr:hypothetical protein MPK66_gp255 [Erwinia phage pEa_SNUABM_2]QZE59499.1 hypothetical protein pEaSNUABM2_00255 [Erwinia phage pEa_SNUABM_2]QZE59835.1 hypothetical protein pEaSNUABM39_00255 [Erwinia phage pEa_SNUABM_39]